MSFFKPYTLYKSIPGGQVHTAASFLDSQLAFGPQGSSKHGSLLHLKTQNARQI